MSAFSVIIVDTNIIFSALLNNDNKFVYILFSSKFHFFICEQALVELFNYKEKIVKYSRLSSDKISDAYKIIIKKITLFKEDLISVNSLEIARHLCQDIDENDTPHVALTL
ncbi:PIN domain-containing protein [Aphanothece hegewaldii]|uniref:PIN domain-containing protein n=1 Tax=Aphanothece hegewaldii TaxID=1521625 RepID=UPI001FED0E26|nr:PIN domain-containing protein [Aphanothece hegewaldii]